MDKGVVPPCLELGGEQHWLLGWMTRNRNKRTSLVLMGVDKLGFRSGASQDDFDYLEDVGCIEREDHGESYRYRIQVFCFCSGGDSRNPVAPGDSEVILPRSGDVTEPPVGLVVGGSRFSSLSSNGVKSKSAQKPVNTVELARDYFPQVMAGTGLGAIRLQSNWPALARGLKLWKANFGVSTGTIQLMMDEFGRHPEWCRASNKPPWRIFLARRDELASLMETRRRRDPGNRRYSAGQGKEFWLGGHTARAYSPA